MQNERSQDYPFDNTGKSDSGVGMGIGVPHRHYAVTDSTNARARELAAAGAPHGTVVTADEQTEGRGRQGRVWVAPRGRALLYSLLLRPLGERPLLPLAAALAVCETAEGLAPDIVCKIKWPNDVLVEGRKLAGILIEAHPATGEGCRSGHDWAVVGVGLNLTIKPNEFPPELRELATSLALATSHDHRATGFPPGETQRGAITPSLRCTGGLSAALGRWVDAEDESILTSWEARDALRGREVAWDGGSGVAGGVDGRGNLIVATTSGGTVTLNAGEVHLSA